MQLSSFRVGECKPLVCIRKAELCTPRIAPKRRIALAIVLVTLGVSALHRQTRTEAAQQSPVDPPWTQILGPADGSLPDALPQLVWRDKLAAALELAREENRPLFVTLRCLPCKQCADFDKDVLEGGGALDPLLRQFVTVRLTTMRDLDLRLFPIEGFQDLDLSWWGWFLSPDARVYGVYGGRDEVSDTTRISVESLTATLGRVLAHHYDPRRAKWNIDGPPPDQSGTPRTPLELAGWKSWARRGAREVASDECLHCHQVAEVLRQPMIDAGRFDKRRDFDMWPLPENVGILLDRDHGLRVKSVEPGSPAYQTGIRAGDVLGAAAGRRLFGQADFRAALHRGPRGPGRIGVLWTRDGTLESGDLVVTDGWRATVLGWRSSVAGAALGAHPGISWVHAPGRQVRQRLGIADDAMAVRPWFGKKPGGLAWEAGLRPSDIITAVNGRSPNVAGRAFMIWFRLNHEPGDSVALTVCAGNDAPRIIRYELPKRRN